MLRRRHNSDFKKKEYDLYYLCIENYNTMQIKEHTNDLLRNGQTTQAIRELTDLLKHDLSPVQNNSSAFNTTRKDEIHYLLGNTYYKLGEWKEAIQHYQEACEYNAESPAKEKLKMTYSILQFYNKDVYGQ